nr:26s proteasome regulatory subunit rpn12 [Quercus suber]
MFSWSDRLRKASAGQYRGVARELSPAHGTIRLDRRHEEPPEQVLSTSQRYPILHSRSHDILTHLDSLKPSQLQQAPQLLSRAKLALLKINALAPEEDTSTQHLIFAVAVLEGGALLSIRLKDTDAFTRYYQQLQPFYDLPKERWSRAGPPKNQGKVTGLYLLLLLSIGDYAGFHTVLEGLEMNGGKAQIEKDQFIQYPVRLEQALMEGSYDKVWGETKGERVPSEEFGVFSEVLINTIRSEIASCSERAYPSLPISNAKNLLFLDSEGAVVSFAQSRGWVAKEGRIYFPEQEADLLAADKDVMSSSGTVIENTLGYARKLETIHGSTTRAQAQTQTMPEPDSTDANDEAGSRCLQAAMRQAAVRAIAKTDNTTVHCISRHPNTSHTYFALSEHKIHHWSGLVHTLSARQPILRRSHHSKQT